MKAVGLCKYLPIEDPRSLVDLDIQDPGHPTGHDLLVAIKAISVNPLDTKIRRGTIRPPENENMPRILGWDTAVFRPQNPFLNCSMEGLFKLATGCIVD